MGTRVRVTYVAMDEYKPILSASSFEELREGLDEYYGVQLAEIELTDRELPYEYFLANRFAFTEENLKKLIELIKDCSDITFSMDELLKQTELVEA